MELNIPFPKLWSILKKGKLCNDYYSKRQELLKETPIENSQTNVNNCFCINMILLKFFGIIKPSWYLFRYSPKLIPLKERKRGSKIISKFYIYIGKK